MSHRSTPDASAKLGVLAGSNPGARRRGRLPAGLELHDVVEEAWCSSLLTAQLEVLHGVSAELAHTAQVEASLGAILQACLSLSSAPRGALLIASTDGDFTVGAARGFAGPDRAELEAFFGRAELRALLRSATGPIPLCADSIECDGCSHVAPRLGSSAIVLPLLFLAEPLGALVLVDPASGSSEELRGVAGELGVELGLGLALARALAEPEASERCQRALLESAGEAVIVCDLRAHILEVNRAAERLLGRPREQLLQQGFDALVQLDPQGGEGEGGARLCAGQAQRPDGESVAVELSRSMVDLGHEQLTLIVVREAGADRGAKGGEPGVGQAPPHGVLAQHFGEIAGEIATYAEVLLAELHPDGTRREQVQRIHAAARRAFSLTHCPRPLEVR